MNEHTDGPKVCWPISFIEPNSVLTGIDLQAAALISSVLFAVASQSIQRDAFRCFVAHWQIAVEAAKRNASCDWNADK